MDNSNTENSVGSFSFLIVHQGSDINEYLLAVSNQDAFKYLDTKYGEQVLVVSGGTSTCMAKQITPEALKIIQNFKV